MRDDDRIRVLHMIDAAESVLQFTAGRDLSDLEEDRMLLFAVVRAIEVMGEAASKVTEDTSLYEFDDIKAQLEAYSSAASTPSRVSVG